MKTGCHGLWVHCWTGLENTVGPHHLQLPAAAAHLQILLTNPLYKPGVCFCPREQKRVCSVFSGAKPRSAHVTYIVMAEHDSFGLARGSWGVDECAALVGLLAGDDGVERLIGLIPPKLHEISPLERTNKITDDPSFVNKNILFLSFTASLLTVYRFGLSSFSGPLYWIMAFKCGSLSSTCKQMKYNLSTSQMENNQ